MVSKTLSPNRPWPTSAILSRINTAASGQSLVMKGKLLTSVVCQPLYNVGGQILLLVHTYFLHVFSFLACNCSFYSISTACQIIIVCTTRGSAGLCYFHEVK